MVHSSKTSTIEPSYMISGYYFVSSVGRVPAQRDSVLCNKGQSADRRFCYNTRYAVKYYQLGGFLASTEALLFYN